MESTQPLDLTYRKALLVNSSSHTEDPRIMHEMCLNRINMIELSSGWSNVA
jgi:hypothetical protein